MMSRWCDQSIPDERHSAFSSGPLEVAVLFGTLVAETILASVHVRAHKQAGHMDASDLIKTLQNTLQGGGRPHMGNHARSMAPDCRGAHDGTLGARERRGSRNDAPGLGSDRQCYDQPRHDAECRLPDIWAIQGCARGVDRMGARLLPDHSDARACCTN